MEKTEMLLFETEGIILVGDEDMICWYLLVMKKESGRTTKSTRGLEEGPTRSDNRRPKPVAHTQQDFGIILEALGHGVGASSVLSSRPS